MMACKNILGAWEHDVQVSSSPWGSEDVVKVHYALLLRRAILFVSCALPSSAAEQRPIRDLEFTTGDAQAEQPSAAHQAEGTRPACRLGRNPSKNMDDAGVQPTVPRQPPSSSQGTHLRAKFGQIKFKATSSLLATINSSTIHEALLEYCTFLPGHMFS